MKFLASDFDETIFFPNDIEKTKKNVEAIKMFMKEKNQFCIITGRNYTRLKADLEKYDIPYSFLICEDGAKVFNNLDYCIHTILLHEEDIEIIESVLKENNIDYYLDDGYDKTEYRKNCVKVVVRCIDPVEKQRIVDLVREKVDIHVYASSKHVNIIDKEVNKEVALTKLVNMAGLDTDHLYVIGDNDNDYEMLKEFQGAIVKDHSEKLDSLGKEVYNTFADYVEYLLEKDKLLKK